jgi:hypothetical protein
LTVRRTLALAESDESLTGVDALDSVEGYVAIAFPEQPARANHDLFWVLGVAFIAKTFDHAERLVIRGDHPIAMGLGEVVADARRVTK